MTTKQKHSLESYTFNVLRAMIDGMVVVKESHGFKRLNNGLFEDCLGSVYSADLVQKAEVTSGASNEIATEHDGWACKEDQLGVINHVILKLKTVAVIGRF